MCRNILLMGYKNRLMLLADHHRILRGSEPSTRNPDSTDGRRWRSIKCSARYWLWSIHTRTCVLAECADRDCPQVLHAFQASNKTRAALDFDDGEIQLLVG